MIADFTAKTGIKVEVRRQGTWDQIPQRLQPAKLAREQVDLCVVGVGTIRSTLGPAGVLGIPTFTVALRLGINNTRTGLAIILAAQSIAMGVFIMRSFFISLPTELEEAAMIDGCSPFGAFLRVILPLAKAGLMTQVIFNGLTNWNEYFITSIMISTPDRHTLPLAIANFVGRHNVDYPQLFAVLSIVPLPVIIVYLFSQKSFIEGVSAGSVKG